MFCTSVAARHERNQRFTLLCLRLPKTDSTVPKRATRQRGQEQSDFPTAAAGEKDFGQRPVRPTAPREHRVECGEPRQKGGVCNRRYPVPPPDEGMVQHGVHPGRVRVRGAVLVEMQRRDPGRQAGGKAQSQGPRSGRPDCRYLRASGRGGPIRAPLEPCAQRGPVRQPLSSRDAGKGLHGGRVGAEAVIQFKSAREVTPRLHASGRCNHGAERPRSRSANSLPPLRHGQEPLRRFSSRQFPRGVEPCHAIGFGGRILYPRRIAALPAPLLDPPQQHPARAERNRRLVHHAVSAAIIPAPHARHESVAPEILVEMRFVAG
jgi:hypothetical protein